ncbi:MAG: hypothetical protein K5654_08525 [Lachnospiraceae bacterium]|nr:hypothetical protein [Lachnospiraceae bacterium]
MITLTFLLCAIVPFIIIFIIGKLIISLFEKGLDFVIDTVFSLPERLLDALKNKKSGKEKPVKEKASKVKPTKEKAVKAKTKKA